MKKKSLRIESFEDLLKKAEKAKTKRKIRMFSPIIREKDSKPALPLISPLSIAGGVMSFFSSLLFGISLFAVIYILIFGNMMKVLDLIPCIYETIAGVIFGLLITSIESFRLAWKNTAVQEIDEKDLIKNYLLDQVRLIEKDAIGEKSEYQKSKQKLNEFLNRIYVLHEQLNLRAKQNVCPEYIFRMITDLEALRNKWVKHGEQFDEFRGKVIAFVQECSSMINQVSQEIADLEMAKEFNKICGESEGLETTVQNALAGSCDKIFSKIQNLQSEVIGRFEETGMKIALEAAKDSEQLDKIIGHYVPAENCLKPAK